MNVWGREHHFPFDIFFPSCVRPAKGAKPGCIRYFWMTDSCLVTQDVARMEPFEVLSLGRG